ncbi:MAG: hypothetical protein QM493_09170 [Sulfurovum sp.]
MQVNNRSIKRSSLGNLPIEDKPLHILVIEFIENNISTFINDYIDGKNEKGLNNNFVICMNNKRDKESFIFHHGYIEDTSSGNSSEVDIAVIINGSKKAFFVLEAKRLDTTLDKYREREYLIANKGNGGGIERFKRDKHGNGLVLSGMIGYVQTDDFDTWKDKINSWIDEEIETKSSTDIIWAIDDKLKEENQTIKTARYSSSHNCISKKQINLIHLWVKLNN